MINQEKLQKNLSVAFKAFHTLPDTAICFKADEIKDADSVNDVSVSILSGNIDADRVKNAVMQVFADMTLELPVQVNVSEVTHTALMASDHPTPVWAVTVTVPAKS